MNVTELARRLKTTTTELHEHLPMMGFDIGRRAIKINDDIAYKIIREWPRYMRRFTEQKKKEQEEKKIIETAKEKGEIKIPQIITVKDYAALLGIPLSKIMEELMKNGILASLNDSIDFETASIIAEDLGFKVKEKEEKQEEEKEIESIASLIKEKDKSKLKPKPPVIVVMGHVDHGKTKLLDAIRKTNVVDQEAGGITQHIGAYQVEKNNRQITFVDTPGHEAFTAMRSRGAKIADVAILIVAADDGVKPQTVEAINIIKASKLPMVVAINKIDKEGADPEKVKRELTEYGLVPEEWGGKVQMVPISAKKEIGINDLLDMVLLVADLNKDEIVANPDRKAVGTVIESHIDKGEGPVASILIRTGTLKNNDPIVIRGEYYGKVRAMRDYRNQEIKEAPPAMPVRILGLKILPQVGDIIQVPEDASGIITKIKTKKYGKQTELGYKKLQEKEDKKGVAINLIIKADVLGSMEAILSSLEKIEIPQASVNVVRKGLGYITDKDVTEANATSSYLIGFNVTPTQRAEEVAKEHNVEIYQFNIIYKLIEFIKDELKKQIEPEKEIIKTGELKVLAIFKTGKKSQIVGGKVSSGEIKPDQKVAVFRNNEKITEGKVTEVQSGKETVTKAVAHQECGLTFEGEPIIEKEDTIEFYSEQEKEVKI